MEKELIEKLMALRKLNYAKLKKYEEELLQCKREVEEINTQICLINGHTFSDWKQKQNPNLDKNCYLERKCEICGKVERNYNEKALREYSLRIHSIK